MLEVLGLDAHTESVYRGVLANPLEGIAQLCDRLAPPEATVRDCLDQLTDLRLLRSSRENPGALRMIGPERAPELVLRRREQEIRTQQAELARRRAFAARDVAACAHLHPGTVSGATERPVGLDAIRKKLDVLAEEVTRERLSVMPGAQSPPGPDASRPLDESAMVRGTLSADALSGRRWSAPGPRFHRACSSSTARSSSPSIPPTRRAASRPD
nr:hypothetical protein OG409_33575 [Streptomyces sp. NBC_00974]